MNKYLVGTCAFNEGSKIRHVIEKFSDYGLYDVMVVDDGSSDSSLNGVEPHEHFSIVRNVRNRGAGYCVRQILYHAQRKGYEAVLFVSGNNKDDPQDVHALIQALEAGFDLIQGSRYLAGGKAGGHMPIYRKVATRIHPAIFSLLTGHKLSDSTNGFRAIRLSLLDDKRIDLDQKWLERYEMEPYLLYKAVILGYKVIEVPVKKFYPMKDKGYTKMKPLFDWWGILRPIILLKLKIKQ